MLFPIDDLLDETACYELLLSVLHPKGLRCPQGHELPADQAPHDRHREPVVDYRCRACGKVFNVFTGTPLQGVRFPPGRLILILRGFCQGVTTQHLAQELDLKVCRSKSIGMSTRGVLSDARVRGPLTPLPRALTPRNLGARAMSFAT